jgi:hypothetical protein
MVGIIFVALYLAKTGGMYIERMPEEPRQLPHHAGNDDASG